MTQIKNIDPESAQQYINDNECFLLDVRTVAEFESGHLENATNIPILELHLRTHEVPNDKEIIVYCAHGVRSGKAAHYLMGHGYHNVAHISEGLEGMPF